MKPALAALLLFIQPSGLFAKGDTVRITIKGESLLRPIEIADDAVIRQFNVWAGAGANAQSNEGFIVDWSRAVGELPKGLRLYAVAFQTSRPGSHPYTVIYAVDPSSHRGYVYIPAKGEPFYRDNVALILRGTEGNWFRALDAWEQIANPRIAIAQAARNDHN